jgi:hypothetical protein
VLVLHMVNQHHLLSSSFRPRYLPDMRLPHRTLFIFSLSPSIPIVRPNLDHFNRHSCVPFRIPCFNCLLFPLMSWCFRWELKFIFQCNELLSELFWILVDLLDNVDVAFLVHVLLVVFIGFVQVHLSSQGLTGRWVVDLDKFNFLLWSFLLTAFEVVQPLLLEVFF